MLRPPAFGVLLLAAMPAGAQTLAAPVGAAPPSCQGRYAIIRHNDIRPGMMATFEQAVRDHAAFYAAHHIPTLVKAARVLEVDPATRQARYSGSAMVTFTIYADPAAQARSAPDASYGKFVGEYQQSSTMRSEERVCLPDLSQP